MFWLTIYYLLSSFLVIHHNETSWSVQIMKLRFMHYSSASLVSCPSDPHILLGNISAKNMSTKLVRRSRAFKSDCFHFIWRLCLKNALIKAKARHIEIAKGNVTTSVYADFDFILRCTFWVRKFAVSLSSSTRTRKYGHKFYPTTEEFRTLTRRTVRLSRLISFQCFVANIYQLSLKTGECI